MYYKIWTWAFNVYFPKNILIINKWCSHMTYYTQPSNDKKEVGNHIKKNQYGYHRLDFFKYRWLKKEERNVPFSTIKSVTCIVYNTNTCILNFREYQEKKSFFLKLFGWCSGLHSFFCKRKFGLGWGSCCSWRCLRLDGHILSLPWGLWIGHVWCLGGRTGICWARGLWASCVYWHVRHLSCIQFLVLLLKFCPQLDEGNNKNFSYNCYCNSPCQKTY